jgi:RNA polymerase sigma-70 factor (ECF subfamily)
MNESLDHLLARLAAGEQAAAEQLFLAFEPYLRKAVRRQVPAALRAKFDSVDVLQSVWADVLRGLREPGWHFSDADHLRGFLFIAARNRLVDWIRRHHKAAEREEPLAEGDEAHALTSRQPRPSEVAEAEDLWEHILAHCAPEHRPLLKLKRQGYSLAEISARTGLHPDSIRRVLRTLARQLAFARREAAAATPPPKAQDPSAEVSDPLTTEISPS